MNYLMILLLANLLPLQAEGPLTYAEFAPGSLVFCGRGNDCARPMVTIDMQNGTITYGPDYTPDAAAKIFWETIGKDTPCNVEKPK